MGSRRPELPQFPDLHSPPVPCLPGYNLTASKKENKLRPQSSLVFVHGVPVVTEQTIANDPLDMHRHNWLGDQENTGRNNREQVPPDRNILTESSASQNRQYSPSKPPMQWTGKKVPGWLLYDKKMLRFFAYFTESIAHSALEDTRVRQFQIKYFMEDNSVEIIEPQRENSGLPHGKFLHKNKVRLADGTDLTWHHLRVGSSVTIYSRTFYIVGCDEPTRKHYLESGIQMLDNKPLPEDPYQARLQEAAAALAASKDKAKGGDDGPLGALRDLFGPGAVFDFKDVDTKKKQDKLDGKVLRFFCCWDDANNPSGLVGKGQRLPFAIHYYVLDDTIEIVEVYRENTGRDPFPLLLSRRQLPLDPNVPSIGGKPMSPNSRKLLNIKYYNWRDIRIGTTVRVYGRDMFIYDCDQFTKKWYQEHLGLPDAAFNPIPIDFDMLPKRPQLPVPENQCGFGSEEDSMRNVLNLVPKRKPSDYNNYMDNWNKVLRFRSRMVPLPAQRELVSPHDVARRFVFSFHVLDGTISIFEPKQPNSGIRGGTYLERTKVYKLKEVPDGGLLQSQKEPFGHADMKVGSVLNIFSRGFELIEADEHTLLHMEENPEEYPQSDFKQVLSTVRQQLQEQDSIELVKDTLLMLDDQGSGQTSADKVQEALLRARIDINLHEAITLVRHLGRKKDGQVSISQLVQELEPGLAVMAPVQKGEKGSQLGAWMHGQGREEGMQPDYGRRQEHQSSMVVPERYEHHQQINPGGEPPYPTFQPSLQQQGAMQLNQRQLQKQLFDQSVSEEHHAKDLRAGQPDWFRRSDSETSRIAAHPDLPNRGQQDDKHVFEGNEFERQQAWMEEPSLPEKQPQKTAEPWLREHQPPSLQPWLAAEQQKPVKPQYLVPQQRTAQMVPQNNYTEAGVPRESDDGKGISAAPRIKQQETLSEAGYRGAVERNQRDGVSLSTGIKQPNSLWQTTNRAVGGIHNPGSLRH